jgi:hypothetical protein
MALGNTCVSTQPKALPVCVWQYYQRAGLPVAASRSARQGSKGTRVQAGVQGTATTRC